MNELIKTIVQHKNQLVDVEKEKKQLMEKHKADVERLNVEKAEKLKTVDKRL